MGCGRPGYIDCSICNATKYYSHVQRRFGQFSCEPCSKFMKKFLREPKVYTCSQKGNCQIGKPLGEPEPRGVSVNRCKACWLKICLEKFTVDQATRKVIEEHYLPRFDNDRKTTKLTSTTKTINENGTADFHPPLPLPVRKRKLKNDVESIDTCKEKQITRNTSSSNNSGLKNQKTKQTQRNQASNKAYLSPKSISSSSNCTSSASSSPPISPLLTCTLPLSPISITSSSSPSSPFVKGNLKIIEVHQYFDEVSYNIEDVRDEDDNDDNLMIDNGMGTEQCGKCVYCLSMASNDQKSTTANVVVVKQSCRYMKCDFRSILLNQVNTDEIEFESNERNKDGNNNINSNVINNNNNDYMDEFEDDSRSSSSSSSVTVKGNSRKARLKRIPNRKFNIKKRTFKHLFDHGDSLATATEILNTNSPFL